MDVHRSLSTVAEFFRQGRYPYAICGGIAMGIYGFPLPTFDVDVVTVVEAQGPFLEFLTQRGFATVYQSAAFSNHLHPQLGRLDIVYVRGRTAEKLFAMVKPQTGPGGVVVPTVAPEHLVAMKLAAARDDRSRLVGELPALAFLVRLPGVDREQMAEYFQRYGFSELWDELSRG